MTVADLDVQTLDGRTTTLGALTGGRAALVVDLASRCGLTPQFEGWLLSPDGEPVARFRPRTAPEDPQIATALDALHAARSQDG
jgi:glutathione peroxidase-family protein